MITKLYVLILFVSKTLAFKCAFRQMLPSASCSIYFHLKQRILKNNIEYRCLDRISRGRATQEPRGLPSETYTLYYEGLRPIPSRDSRTFVISHDPLYTKVCPYIEYKVFKPTQRSYIIEQQTRNYDEQLTVFTVEVSSWLSSYLHTVTQTTRHLGVHSIPYTIGKCGDEWSLRKPRSSPTSSEENVGEQLLNDFAAFQASDVGVFVAELRERDVWREVVLRAEELETYDRGIVADVEIDVDVEERSSESRQAEAYVASGVL